MSKAIIAVGLILLSFGALVFLAWWNIDNKNTDIEDYKVDLAIFSQDEESNYISTGYAVLSGSTEIKNGTTAAGGAILEKLSMNNTYTIFNYNLEGQNYYTDEVEIKTSENKTYRVPLELREAGDLTIMHDGETYDNNVVLTINANGLFKNAHVCFRWSSYIISVKPPEEYERVENNNGYSKCYFTNTTLKDEKLVIPLEIVRFGDLLKNDEITVFVYDADYLKGEYIHNNVGSEDYEYKIINNIFKQ